MLCRMLCRRRKTGVVPVYLNVYDLTPINGYAYWLGLGVYHSGVQGFLCNCVLPASLNETEVRHIRAEDRTIEKKKLRSHSSRFMSSSNAPSVPTHHSGLASSSRQQSRHPPAVPLIRSTSPSSVLKLL